MRDRDDLLECLEALHAARVPPSWLQISWDSPALGPWAQGLLQRHDQLRTWLVSGRPKSFWLPGFFNPQGFLTAVRQEVARRHAGDKWALDDTVLASEVTKFADHASVKDPPSEGVYIYGLHLEGAGWSAKRGGLVDSEPKRLHQALPVMHVTAMPSGEWERRAAGCIEVPCYRTRKRAAGGVVAAFALKSAEPARKWVLRGAALLCSID
jgi:dynein heavy chain, axonemal